MSEPVQPCPTCGADEHDGELHACPHCRAPKCSLCDMGDDVECLDCAEDVLG